MGSKHSFILIAAAAVAFPAIASAQDQQIVYVTGAAQDREQRVTVVGAAQDREQRVTVVGAANDGRGTRATRPAEHAPPAIPVVYEDEAPAPAPAPAPQTPSR